MSRGQKIIALGALLMVLGAFGVALWRETPSRPAERSVWPSVSATLPPCDDDTPEHPVTGPCWLSDSGTLAVWPYPYASEPLLVLDGSKS